MTACSRANRVLEALESIVKPVCVYSWSDIIKTAVDELKKSGASKNLPSPPITAPPGPLTYSPFEFVYLCLPMFSDSIRLISVLLSFSGIIPS